MSQRRIGTTAVAVAGLLLLSSVAMAADPEEGDTLVNYGYDEENHLLVFNISSTEGSYDCTLQHAETESEYELAYVTTDGLIEVDGLTSGAGEVTFANRPEDEVGDDFEPAPAPGDYATATDCRLEATEVTGANGQVNHGMFMNALKSLYDVAHRGCVVRHFAQSDMGQGEQQIRTADADPDFEPGEGAAGFAGTVDFTSVVTDCERGNDDELEAESEGSGAKKAKKSKGRPDSPGKSGSAPGRQGR